MIGKSSRNLVVILIISALAWSCSPYQKLLKSSDYDKKYEAALKYFEKKDYFRSSALLEELMPVFRGTKKAEKVYYLYAYTQFHLDEFEIAAYHFENFTRTFPNSEFTEECMYMIAHCYYLDSPVYSLDQTNTYKAINQMQLYINKYPSNNRMVIANEVIDLLRAKLETKAFENSRLYYRMEDYKSAIFALKNVLRDFPDTKYREECQFLMLKANYEYAVNSIEAKRKDRYKATIDAYNSFANAFPKSKYLKEAQNIYEETIRKLDKSKSDI